MQPTEFDIRQMRTAIRMAQEAAEQGEVPVGALIVQGQEIIGRSFNQTETLKDPTAHAEIIAITQAASAMGDWRLLDTTLYITKEPCPMCAGAIVLARIPRVIWGLPDPVKGGAVSQFNILSNPALNHRPEIYSGLLEEECREVIQRFFQDRRREGTSIGD